MTELAKRIVELAKGLPAIERATLIDEDVRDARSIRHIC